MARFFGSVQGARGEVTRLGHKSSGMAASVNGWGIGMRASARAIDDDRDGVVAFVTKGSGYANVPNASLAAEELEGGGCRVIVYIDGATVYTGDFDANGKLVEGVKA